MTTTSAPVYMTLPETARAARSGTSTVRRWIATGELPAVRAGRRLLIDPDDLRAFMRRRAVRPRTLSA